VREFERLVSRIRQMRRVSGPADNVARRPGVDPAPEQLRALEERMEHLEALVQGLQDSVHRESTRLTKRVGELEARVQPGVLGKARCYPS
jgi:hypothetical protein